MRPVLFYSGQRFQPGISPVSRYSNYDSDETGDLGACTGKAWEKGLS